MEDPTLTIFFYKVNVFSAELMEIYYMVFFAVSPLKLFKRTSILSSVCLENLSSLILPLLDTSCSLGKLNNAVTIMFSHTWGQRFEETLILNINLWCITCPATFGASLASANRPV